MRKKLQNLKKDLSEMKSALIAYSGGVDSTFLLKLAQEVLGGNLMAVIAESPTYPAVEAQKAKETAKKIGVRYLTIYTEELKDGRFSSNPIDRCYWCKKELFSRLIVIAKENNLNYVIDGSNYDDISDYRPGREAGKELGIRSPLQEAKITKQEIRVLSKKMGLSTWDKPSFACLSSRFPFGTQITKEKLAMVEKAEEFIHSHGIKQVRVRHHGEIARIEVENGDIERLTKKDLREMINTRLKELGYRYVAVDLAGYRTGSLNPKFTF